MQNTNGNSSRTTEREPKRAPFQPVTRLEQVIIALYEVKDLARREKSKEIVPLINSVIQIIQDSGKSLADLPRVGAPHPLPHPLP